LHYVRGEYGDVESLRRLAKFLADSHPGDQRQVLYMSVPPSVSEAILGCLKQMGCSGDGKDRFWPKVVVEKPFGLDVEGARRLNRLLASIFCEDQIYRVDHYLAKSTVQNLMVFRFGNAIWEPLWNNHYVDHVQITAAEKVGVEGRGSYYEEAGVVRDMVQNHVLQVLALVAMEPPISFDAEAIRDERTKLLRTVRPFDPQNLAGSIVRGQYAAGRIGDQDVPAYLSEKGVAPGSRTETYVAARLFIDNWRWKDVPFYLRTGKRLAKKDTEIVVTFKEPPHSLFASAGLHRMPPNVLAFQIQPKEGISLWFQAKRPGSKICIGTLDMKFRYQDIFGVEMPEAYQRLLLDCMTGDQTLFTRFDGIEVTWRLLMPVLESWERSDEKPHEYPAGSESFPQADALPEADGRQWHGLTI